MRYSCVIPMLFWLYSFRYFLRVGATPLWFVWVSLGVVLRTGRPWPRGFYHVFIAFLTTFFASTTANLEVILLPG